MGLSLKHLIIERVKDKLDREPTPSEWEAMEKNFRGRIDKLSDQSDVRTVTGRESVYSEHSAMMEVMFGEEKPLQCPNPPERRRSFPRNIFSMKALRTLAVKGGCHG